MGIANVPDVEDAFGAAVIFCELLASEEVPSPARKKAAACTTAEKCVAWYDTARVASKAATVRVCAHADI